MMTLQIFFALTYFSAYYSEVILGEKWMYFRIKPLYDFSKEQYVSFLVGVAWIKTMKLSHSKIDQTNLIHVFIGKKNVFTCNALIDNDILNNLSLKNK